MYLLVPTELCSSTQLQVNLAAIDLFQIVSGTTSGAAANLSGGVTLNVDFNGAANISAISAGYGVARAGNATSYVVTDASGIATFEGDLSGTVNSSVTAAVEAIDKSVITGVMVHVHYRWWCRVPLHQGWNGWHQ